MDSISIVYSFFYIESVNSISLVQSRPHEDSSEEGRHIRQLEQLLEQKETEMVLS